MNKEIVVNSIIKAKESPTLKKIQHKATAGISEAELIKKYTIGEYDKEEDDEREADV